MPLQLLTSYLSNCQHYTTIKNTKSQSANISCGVSLGSVLGPLLFIMYVNDLPNCSAFKTVLYADDTYLSLSHKHLHVLKYLVNSELAKADKWMHLNRLSINYSKSVYMLTRCIKSLCSPTELTSFNVHINNVLLSVGNDMCEVFGRVTVNRQ